MRFKIIIHNIFFLKNSIQTNAIGGSILASSVASLVDVGAASADRMSAYLSSPMIIGGPVQSVFVLFIVVFQLALIWVKE